MRPHSRSLPRRTPVLALLLAAALTPAPSLLAGDGDLDPTWGGDGISEGYPSSLPRASSVAADQRLYFAGRRLTPDDSEIEFIRNDNSGGNSWHHCEQGLALLDNFDIHETLIDSSNRLLVTGTVTVFGTETVQRAFLARFTSPEGCELDDAFSGAGWEYLDDAPYCDTEDCRLIDIEESGDATTRYVALLESVQGTFVSEYFLVGLTASGVLDPNFGTGGFSLVTAPDLAPMIGDAAELAVDAANRLYVLFSFFDPDFVGDLDVGLDRFQSDGDLDTAFGNAGTLLIDAADFEATLARALAIGSDGRIGYGLFNDSDNDSKVRVFEPSFESSVGDVLTHREIGAIAFDGLGRLLAASDLTNEDGLEITRWTPIYSTGFLLQDEGFGFNGLRFVDIDGGGGNAETPVDLETPGGRPMILVEADQSAGVQRVYLVRLQNELIFADGFEWGSTKFW